MKMKFDRFILIDFSILRVNCSHLCIKYVKVFEKVLSGDLEVSFSIQANNSTIGKAFRSVVLAEPFT